MFEKPLPRALLEDWMRDFYFDTEIDIGSSGVEDWSMAEVRRFLDLSHEELDALVFHDSRTLGGPEIRQAVADRWGDGDPERAIATHGATEANFLVMAALLEKGDEVVVLDPIYQQLHSIAESLGCRMRRWPLRPENGFQPDLDDARKVIGPGTRMIVVNFPHNPTGATVTAEGQRELIGLASRAGAYLVWDMAFSDLVYESEPLPEPGASYDKGISMGTLSKAYGLPGLRVGWCLAAPEVLQRFIVVRDYLTLHLSPLVELIAARAIRRGDRLVEPRLRQARDNRERLRTWVEENAGLVSWVPPLGGVCAFPRLERVDDTIDFCRRFGEEDKVLLVPGEAFGAPGHVRLGFGGNPAQLGEGLRRLAGALRRLHSA